MHLIALAADVLVGPPAVSGPLTVFPLFARGDAHAGLTGAAYWTDAALLAAAGVPTVLLGPAGGGPHAGDEWVDLGSVTRVRDTLLRFVRDFCGSAR